MNVKITYQNETKEVPINTTYLEISKLFNLKNIIGIKINNDIISLNSKATKDQVVEFFDVNSIEGTKMYKAGLKFILEVAIKTIFKNSDIYFLHSVPGGMLGEIIYDKTLTDDDISLIKKEMANIIDGDYPFIKYNILKEEAKDFYLKTNCLEKEANLRNTENIITIHKLKNYLNYFYIDLPNSTNCLKNFSLQYLGNNRLIILYPSNLTHGKLPDYVHHENIIKSFYEGKSWLKKLNTPYVSDLNDLIYNYKIKGFIESCELHFNDQIRKVSEEIIRSNNIKFVMIAGPSSSGKTTTTRVLGAYLRSLGYEPICLSTDDYFVEREYNPKNDLGEYDFECLNAIDIKLLNENLKALLNGKEVSIPTFNFITGKKEYHNNIIKLKENSIILIEGLHCLNDDLIPYIDKKYKYKVYLSPFIPLNIDRHNYISTIDLRLIRRMIRDSRTRGINASDTIKNWQSVRDGEEKYIFPYTHQADTIINTALPYELGVLKIYAEPLLLTIDSASPFYAEARRLVKFLKSFYPISSELVSKDSILREFIGGR